MTKCYPVSVQFSSVKRCQVEVDFSGGDITSNDGIPCLCPGGPVVELDSCTIAIPTICSAIFFLQSEVGFF